MELSLLVPRKANREPDQTGNQPEDAGGDGADLRLALPRNVLAVVAGRG